MTGHEFKMAAVGRLLRCESGFLLVAGLTLMTILTLLGTTAYILSSTDIKIGGNFRNSQMVLQAATAGAERARELLRIANAASTNSTNRISFSDELAARVGANLVLDGYALATDDPPYLTGSMTGLTGVSYTVYLTNDDRENLSQPYGGKYLTTDSNKKAMLTSVATGPNNSKAQVQIVVMLEPGPQIPAPIYTKSNMTGNGSSLTINGNDACGLTSPIGTIYTKSPGTTNLNGNPTLTGNPSAPQAGPLDIDINGYINRYKSGATVVSADQSNTTFGSATNYTRIYSDTNNPPNANGLKMNGVTGYGILMVEGDLEMGGGFNWHGLILVTGTVKYNGGGGPNSINVNGAVLANNSVTTNGSIDILYDSCKISNSLVDQPLKLVNWKHVY